jgi:hypothetical protein
MVAENLRHWRIQLVDRRDGTIIQTAGGAVIVCQANLADKAVLKNSDGSAAVNPVPLNRGLIDFYTASTVDSVDLYGIAPGGQAIEQKGIIPSGPNEIYIDGGNRDVTYKIPYSFNDDAGDAVETDTGLDLPASALVYGRKGGTGLLVTAIDAAETIDVGTLQSEGGGDANGLIAASSIGTAGAVTPTDGALIATDIPYNTDSQVAKSISYTLSTGTDTGKGFFYLGVKLLAA